jgi:hypothetical protein
LLFDQRAGLMAERIGNIEPIRSATGPNNRVSP